MKSWSELPLEIQTIVFELLNYCSQVKRNLCNCQLVCKSWETTAQHVLYSDVDFLTKTQFDTFINTIKANKQYGLEKSVKKVCLSWSMYSFNDFQSAVEIIAIHLPYVAILSTNEPCRDFYLALLHAGIDSKFKYLEDIPEPDDMNDTLEYTSCALLYKNQLTHLELSDHFDKDSYTPNIEILQYNRLLDKLDLFTHLTHLYLERSHGKNLDTLELVVEKCKALKSLQFDSSGNDAHDDDVIELSRYVPRPNIKEFLYTDVDDYGLCINLLPYVMRKYPRLENRQLELGKCNHTFVKPSIVAQFFPFLANIPIHIIYDLPVKTNLLDNLLENYWKASSGKKLQHVELEYNRDVDPDLNNTMLTLIRQRNCAQRTIIKYEISSNSLDLQLPNLQKLGSRIGKLSISLNQLESDSICALDMATDVCLDQALKYCPNLTQLSLKKLLIKQANCSMFTNTSIETLDLQDCSLYEDGLLNLSHRLPSLKTLIISRFNYTRPSNVTNAQNNLIINMVNTNFETLKLNGLSYYVDVGIISVNYNGEMENVYLKLSIGGNDDKYYKHVEIWKPTDKIYTFSDSNEDEYNDSLEDITRVCISIRCKSIATLSIITFVSHQLIEKKMGVAHIIISHCGRS